jgi:predicted permease
MAFYRALLRLFPASFRREYGREMAADFAVRRKYTRGAAAVVGLWMGAVADIGVNAARVHFDILRQDVRHTWRSLRRVPGFAFTVVGIAALGVGATSAAFSIADHVLIRPLPFPSSDRLVELYEASSDNDRATNDVSPPNYRDWKARTRSFDAMAAYRYVSINLVDATGGGPPERLGGAAMTADLLPLLGVRPEIGRVFDAADDEDGAPGTVLLSDRFWTSRFSRDPGVIGRTLRLDDRPYEVIGVMPPAFRFPSRDAEVWTPMQFAPAAFENRNDNYLHVVGRLRPGVSVAQSRGDARQVAAALEREHPLENAKVSVAVVALRDQISPQSRLLLVALVTASAALLLIACANLSNLLLVRGLTRRRELALRTALGAGPERLVRQMLTESALHAAAAGVLGVAIAAAMVPAAARLVPTSLPIAATPALDLRMLFVAALVTAATGLGFGVLPALRARRGRNPVDDLLEGARAGAGPRTERMRSTLVIISVSLSVALLVVTGLLVRALWRVQSVDPGFRADGVLTLRTSLPMPKYERSERRDAFYRAVLERIRQVPGVADAAYISFLPMVMRGGIWRVDVPGQPYRPGEAPMVSLRFVTPGFFRALSIPIRAGRDVSESDAPGSQMVAVVSESFVRRHWPGENPIGRHFEIAEADRIVVGVVGDIRVRGLERGSEPQVYLPYQQHGEVVSLFYAPKDLVVRAAGAPESYLPSIRRVVAAVDPSQPISDERSLAEIVASETATRSVQLRVLTGFAAIACLLAAFGIHGLLSFAVSTQTREIGVRVALGASRSSIVGLITRRAGVLSAVGLTAGLGLGAAAGRTLESALAGVSPADAATFVTAAGLVFAMALAGTLASAIRAIRIEPMQAIRRE